MKKCVKKWNCLCIQLKRIYSWLGKTLEQILDNIRIFFLLIFIFAYMIIVYFYMAIFDRKSLKEYEEYENYF